MGQHDVIKETFPRGVMHPRGEGIGGGLLFDVVMQDDGQFPRTRDALRSAGIRVDTVEAMIGHFTIEVMPPDGWLTVGAIVGLEQPDPNS